MMVRRNMKAIRKLLNLRQVDVAGYVGVSQGQISFYETNGPVSDEAYLLIEAWLDSVRDAVMELSP